MKRIVYTTAAFMMAVIMSASPLSAQVRSGGTTRQSGTSTQSGGTSRQSGSTSTSGSTSRQSSGTSTSSGSTTRQSGSSATSTSSGSTSRQSGSTYQIGGTTRQSGSTSTTTSGSTSRQSGGTSTTTSGGTTRQSGSTSTTTSGSTSRQSGSTSTTTSGGTTRQSGGTSTTSTGGTTRQSGTTTSSGTTRQSGTTTSSSGTTSTGTTRTSNVTRTGLNSGANTSSASGGNNNGNYRDDGGNYRYEDDWRMDDNHDLNRISPRERSFLDLSRPTHFWGRDPHYYGYRVRTLPTGYRRINHWGIDYYYHNGIYYRSYGNVWVVSRPPYGTALDVIVEAALFRPVTFSYYSSVYRTYNTVFDNYNVIAQQNLIIAQNNARIIAQNGALALNNNRALSAYEIANRLGLVQSYAYANSQYYYQDGVFFIVTASGQFTTIVPPAGALVTSLPDDYDIIVMNGVEYYLVDNTVYRTTLFNGQPFLEVLGQMYGSMYNQYSPYYR